VLNAEAAHVAERHRIAGRLLLRHRTTSVLGQTDFDRLRDDSVPAVREQRDVGFDWG